MTSDLWRFSLPCCLCMVCILVGADRGKAVPQVGEYKCSFGTCLKPESHCHKFDWLYDLRWLVWLTNSTDRILVNIQKPILSLFLCFQRRRDACFLFTPSFLLSLPWLLQKYTELLTLPSCAGLPLSRAIWHLYLPFSRKLQSQLNNLYSVFIYYQSALSMVSTQDEVRDVHPGTSGWVFFYGWYNPVADLDLWKRTGLWWANYSSHHIFQLLLSGRSF